MRQIILRLVAHAAQPGECILVFLPGIAEIADLQDELDPAAATRALKEGAIEARPQEARTSRAQGRPAQGAQTPLQVLLSLCQIVAQRTCLYPLPLCHAAAHAKQSFAVVSSSESGTGESTVALHFDDDRYPPCL